MATSNVAIANGALQRLGAKRIESLTQDHPNARSMNAAFEGVRRQLLRKYDWSFAIKRDSLAADGDKTTWGNHNRFGLPNDYIRLLLDDESGSRVDWQIEGLFIVTDDSAPLDIRYIADIIDPNYFDSLFTEAFECALAAKCCKEITGSETRVGSINEDFDDAIADAKRVGAIEKPAREFPEDDWLAARR